MGLAADTISIDYYASGSTSRTISPPAIHLILSDQELGKKFKLYRGTGGAYSALIPVSPTGSNTHVEIDKRPDLAQLLNEIREVFPITKNELASVLQRSRKTLYNWDEKGSNGPKKKTMDRIFALLVIARDWAGSGFSVEKSSLHEPIVNNQSLFEMLSAKSLDKSLILFAGTRLQLSSPVEGRVTDPFA